MLKRRISTLFLGLLAVVVLGVSERAPVTAAPAGSAVEMFEQVNQFRVQNGLPPFRYNAALSVAAQNHANWMATALYFSHTQPNGSTPQSRATAAGYLGYVSENIVGGTNMSARQGLIWWQNSPTHYNTMASIRYVEAGTGFAVNTQENMNMYVLVVGQPGGSDPSVSSSAANNATEPLIITPIQLAEPREDGSIVHVMQQGQALWTIAAYYDVDLDYLMMINGLDSKDILHPGDEVYVQLADGQPPPPTPTPPLHYTVQEGDSLWLIAARNAIELDYLLLLNNLQDDSVLRPGDELRVRLAEGELPPPTPTPSTTHIVREGQSLWSIAALYGLTLEQLLAFNGLTADAMLRPGDELTIRQPEPTAVQTAVATVTLAAGAREVAMAGGSPSATPQSSHTPAAAGLAQTTSIGNAAKATPGSSGEVGLLAIAVGLTILAGVVIVLARRQPH
jgi:LysM repeat protein